MKIIYYVGETVTLSTIMKKGSINKKENNYIIQSNDDVILLNDLHKIEFYRFHGLSTLIRLVNGQDIIYLTVPWIYLDIAGGIGMINTFKTKKLKKVLSKLTITNN